MLLEVGAFGAIRKLGHEQPPICISLNWAACPYGLENPPQLLGAVVRWACLPCPLGRSVLSFKCRCQIANFALHVWAGLDIVQPQTDLRLTMGRQPLTREPVTYAQLAQTHIDWPMAHPFTVIEIQDP